MDFAVVQDPKLYLLLAAAGSLVSTSHLARHRVPTPLVERAGHQPEISRQLEVGDLQKKWIAEYGLVWRMKGTMSENSLEIADPKALQYIFHKSGYHFPKTATSRQFSREITGPGILFAQDKDHTRIRKIMNPAFTAAQLKSFLPLFLSSTQKLGQKWKEILQNADERGERINVTSWLARCTLDVIGEVGFDVQCGALDDSLNPVMEAFNNMFADAIPNPSKFTIFFRSTWHLIPMSILKYVKYWPTKDHRRFRKTLDVINAFAKELITEKTAHAQTGKDNKKDIMSLLVRANASEDPRSRLTEDEMISQVATFLLAGHETTASSMTWILWELAKHPEYQSKIRAEVRAVRARVTGRGDSEYSVADLDTMTYTLAAMKEILRLHPIVYALVRYASRDDVLPLARPLTLVDGTVVTELPVPKGTDIQISIWAYNRLPEIWGPDAEEFNPHRFIDQEKKMGSTYVGVTSNLMTFSAGLQACLGWRFSIIEMQAILVELIEHFEFAIPDDKPEILRYPAGLVAPLVKSDMAAGPQMPLRVSLAQ
ncbi:PAH-inducible cytochrome P450 monooxygenase PC-PAH 1 [Epithele typhae]|uniref:PAH-inducible cytochrome P450 monooxygenase PC-PAH 1 n=1 Tax=Epithele typhae TaxID=378194 RepID=UPI002008935D|nr:PAH-inducible cytochrome P450 monooxygenase PC-PAH 1 [Epithele typhae]KAH9935136.1 PAH-inducible cytochrome P450 monooxygenase PC-PAH 1 [Epithele typhae]